MIRDQLGIKAEGTVRAYGSIERRKTLTTRKGGDRRDQPRKKEGHDALIEALRNKGAWIYVTTTDNEEYDGELLQSDRFTISFLQEGDEVPTIMFKHSIKCFHLTVPQQADSEGG